MPFIKLANRKLGVVVFWTGTPPPAGDREVVERALTRRFETTYREPTNSYSRTGPFTGFDAALALALAVQGADDTIVVEAELVGGQPESVRAHVRVMVLETEKTAVEADVGPVPAQGGLASDAVVTRVADAIWLPVARSWTDPAANPPLNPLRIADRLADKGACEEAVKIFQQSHLPAARPRTVAEAQVYAHAGSRMAHCQTELALKAATEADRTATFSFKVAHRGLAPDLVRAVEGAVQRSQLGPLLARNTDKPAVLEATPEALTLVIRYHPERYQRLTASRPTYVMNQRALYLEPWLEVMRAITWVREDATSHVPPTDTAMMSQLPLVLRLQKILGDRVEVDFGEHDGRVIVGGTLHVTLGSRPEAAVTTAAPKLLHDYTIVLGPASDESGALTNYGLLYKFFELE